MANQMANLNGQIKSRYRALNVLISGCLGLYYSDDYPVGLVGSILYGLHCRLYTVKVSL